MPRISRKNSNKIDEVKKKYSCGIYVRLSKYDNLTSSDSISNQKDIVLNFLKSKKDISVTNIYEDVGKTGTSFNREGFNRLLNDIKDNKINCIVVKDLSRFGRNYIEVGRFLEYIFPFIDVRFISVNDNYDSLYNKDFNMDIPIKNLMNELYAKEVSDKVKYQYSVKRANGEFCGSFAPYGYIKKGNELFIDEKVKDIVIDIFNCFNEYNSIYKVVKMLNTLKHFPPSRYRYENNIVTNERFSAVTTWHKSTVKRILTNEVYIGNLVGGKSMRSVLNNRLNNDLVIIKDNHKAIISKELFFKVNEKLSVISYE